MTAPLADTVARLDLIEPSMNAVRLGLPSGEGEWVSCADVIDDPGYVRRWQVDMADFLATLHPAPPDELRVTAAACVLDAYAYAPGFLAGAMFHVARRVPRLAPDVVAFRRDPAEHWISGVAVLDGRFWCLPDDPAAGAGGATVVADRAALATVARAQVRAHADAFLRTYDPGVRLPRRALRGVFLDSLDSGPWIAEPLVADRSCLASSEALLPGAATHFRDGSRLYELSDLRGRRHIARRRVACCESYRIEPEGCFDCPRTTDDRRVELATGFPD